jgi:hypothetical protein
MFEEAVPSQESVSGLWSKGNIDGLPALVPLWEGSLGALGSGSEGVQKDDRSLSSETRNVPAAAPLHAHKS